VVSVEPVLTAATAYVLFGERLDATQLTGSAMILAAVVFLRLYEGWIDGLDPPGPRRDEHILASG
jgi:drug/metabolite transporter (DMT)-like permease